MGGFDDDELDTLAASANVPEETGVQKEDYHGNVDAKLFEAWFRRVYEKGKEPQARYQSQADSG
eukprot:11062693-Ditylum_brightwellii.AAC.1